MGVIRVGEYEFYECNVAFHFIRDNPYSPWQCIGVYFTHPKYQNCRYVYHYSHITKEFQDEVKSVDSEYIRGGPEFLEIWRRRYYSPLEVISPVINYCTTYRGEFRDLLTHLFTKYVAACSPTSFAMLTLMIKKREMFFPAIFKDGKQKEPITRALVEAGLV